MREVISVGLDFLVAVIRRGLVMYLLWGMVPLKSRFAKKEKWVCAGFVAMSMVFYLLATYQPGVRKILYGSADGMRESRASILPLAISLSLMLIYCLYFYAGRKSRVCYLVFTAYTLNELVMFTIQPLFALLLGGISALVEHLVLGGNAFVLRHFDLIFGLYQTLWELAFYGTLLTVLYHIMKIIKRNLSGVGRGLTGLQELFLAVPCGMGFCFCIMLRSVMYAFKDSGLYFLMDEYPETRLLVPVVSGLGLLSLLLSAVILKKLVQSGEREMLVEVYRNRISDMEEHMKDVERLCDGIRGMRHDMRNCVADLEILLKKGMENSGEYEEDIHHYLDGMCLAMEELDMKCSTGNPVTDVVIGRKMRRAEKENIPFTCSFIFPEGIGISAFDLSILLNNALDNAIEASLKEKSPYVRVDSYARGNMFFIEIRNAFSGELTEDEAGSVLQTSKPDRETHGLGIKNMRNCAEKYYGTLRWESGQGEFLLAVMLQGKEKQDEYKN